MMADLSLELFLKARYPQQTVSSYLYSIERFKAENPGYVTFTHQQVADYFFKLKTQKLSCAYRIKILSAVKIFYTYLFQTRQRPDHPCSRFKIQDDTLKGIHFDELFTTEELEELLNRKERYAILEFKNKVIISLLIYQGLTGDELIGLKLSDIDLDSGIVKIKPSAKLSGRSLELHRQQIMLLIRYINDVRPVLAKGLHDKLLVTKTGNPETVDNIHALIQSMQPQFPHKTLNPRQIRQSVIANWLNIEKIPLAEVQLMAGHKWPTSTEKYIRQDFNERSRIINEYHPLEQMQLLSKL